MVSTVASKEKNLYNLIQPQVSRHELGGLCLNEVFSTEYKSFKVLPLTATDLTKEKPQQFVYKIWKKTIEVTVTLTESSEDGFIGKIEWANGGIYNGKISKLQVQGRETGDVFETIIPYADNKHRCEITYKTKSYKGMLEHHLMKNSKTLTFIGNGQIIENNDNYQGNIGFDLFSGEFYPRGDGKLIKESFIFEGNFFYWHDFQGRTKELQPYAKGKLTNSLDGNQYSGSVLYSSTGFTLISLPKSDDKFERATFSISLIGKCQTPKCNKPHYQKISSGELFSKTFSNENYLFGINGITNIYDPKTMDCEDEILADFLVLPKTLTLLLPTKVGEFLRLKIEDKYTYYGSFSITNFEPWGSGIISFANANIYSGKVIFSPDGNPHIFPVKSEEYEISIEGVKKRVKMGYGETTKERKSDYFYFDHEGNFYSIEDKQIKASVITPLKSPPSQKTATPSPVCDRPPSPKLQVIDEYHRRHNSKDNDELKSLTSPSSQQGIASPIKSTPNRRLLKERPPFSWNQQLEVTGADGDKQKNDAT